MQPTSSVRAHAIHNIFYKKKKNTFSSSIVDLSTWEFLGTLEKCDKHLPLACASPLFPLVFKNSRVLVKLNNVLSMFVTSLIICFTLSAYLLIPMLTTSIDNRLYPLDAIKWNVLRRYEQFVLRIFHKVQYKVEQYKNLRQGNNAVMVISMRFH